MSISHRVVETNGIKMHIAEAGKGPLVILCHGWPESWYSWRHQLTALAEAGFHAVAPDMRGYGKTDIPERVDQYTLLHLTADILGLIDVLGYETAAVVGHDWGAPVAWHCALFRPDKIRAVAGLSVPYRPRGSARPTTVMPVTETERFYMLYFQEEGAAEAEFNLDWRNAISTTLYSASGDAPVADPSHLAMIPMNGGWLAGKPIANQLPNWLRQADLEFYVSEFHRTGLRGGFNWYRNIDRNWELLAPWTGAKVQVPALYMVGDRDLVYKFRGMDQAIPNLKSVIPNLRDTIILAGCGHWTQQERPSEVNTALITFLRANSVAYASVVALESGIPLL